MHQTRTKEGTGKRAGFTRQNFSKKNLGGFTLVEMLVYVAILAVIFVLAINITLAMMRAFTDIRVSRDINNAATVALERITRETRAAYDIDGAQSTFGTHPGRLTLLTKDAAGSNTSVEFFVSGSTLRIKEGGVDRGALTPQRVVVDNLVFYSLTGVRSKAVKIEMQITGTRGNVSKTRSFYVTAVLRGSY